MPMNIPSQCKICVNFDKDEYLCRIHEQLPGEYGREDVKDCPSFLESGTKDADDLNLLLKYIDEDPELEVEKSISNAVDRILSDYETKNNVIQENKVQKNVERHQEEHSGRINVNLSQDNH